MFKRKAWAQTKDKATGMNKTEAEYAKVLDDQKHRGEILDYWFEPARWVIAEPRCTLCPDFLVQMPDGELVYHEVKGFFEEDAKVKCKAFITKYPFRLLIVKKDKKAWAIEEFHPVKESK